MKKSMKIFLLSVLFVFVFVISALVSVKLSGSAPSRLMKVEWNDTIGTVYYDLSYENYNGHGYDLYIPANIDINESQHLILYIHGGSFNSGAKEDGDVWCKYYASKGYITATLDYTLQNQGKKADLFLMNNEIKNCVDAINEKCQELGYRVTGMATCGVSAGGTLAMNYAYTSGEYSAIPVKFVFQLAGPASFEPEHWDILKKINGLSTDIEFIEMMTGEEISEEMLVSGDYKTYIEKISPTYLVTESSVPTLLGYGLKDHLVPGNLKYGLVDALDKNEVPYDYLEFPHSNHGMYADLDVLQDFLDLSLDYCNKYFKE